LALALLAVAPSSALAHATLEASTPERGAKLDAVPQQVALRFDEAVEASFGALRVFDQSGREVQAGKPFRPGGDASRVAVKLRAGTKPGGFTVTYRVVSADSHPVSGGFVFTVGDAAAPAKTVDELLQGSDSGPVTATAFSAVRAVQYGASPSPAARPTRHSTPTPPPLSVPWRAPRWPRATRPSRTDFAGC
jgi:copper transport protein